MLFQLSQTFWSWFDLLSPEGEIWLVFLLLSLQFHWSCWLTAILFWTASIQLACLLQVFVVEVVINDSIRFCDILQNHFPVLFTVKPLDALKAQILLLISLAGLFLEDRLTMTLSKFGAIVFQCFKEHSITLYNSCQLIIHLSERASLRMCCCFFF